MSPAILFQSAMFAWIFWAGLTLGCVSMVYLHHSIRAAWSVALLRLFEAGSRTLIPMLAAFLVILGFGGSYLYPWLQPAFATHHTVLHRAAWMNLPWVIGRTVLYFLFWIVSTEWLAASGKREDKSGNRAESQKRFSVAPPVGVIHVIVLTVAITDWVMSLDPGWYSTIFGAWFLISQGLTALSFCTIIMTRSAITGRGPYAGLVTKPMMRDWGNMMLGYTMMWAYFTISQFLIIWSGNLPEETSYFATRLNADWNAMGTLNVFLSFFAPFLLLLYNHTKRDAKALFRAAVLIFVMRIVDMYWTIIPFFHRHGEIATPGTHLVASAGLFLIFGAVWLVIFRAAWGAASPLPRHDPRLAELDPSLAGTVEAHGHA